ncbi:hypothetical protein ACWGCW_11455 [Streptomyces sp. NPDC054933]
MLSDIEALRTLAHTLGQQLLTRSQPRGSVASTADLATEFDVDRGATSYHLRQLAGFGFVGEDAQRSAGRRERKRCGAFVGAALHCFGGTALTSEELAQFDEEYIALLKSWHREPAPGPRHISVLFHAFPTPDPTEAS